MTALRHYWNYNTKTCDCGCKDRVFIRDWICVKKIDEALREQGYFILKKKGIELEAKE